MKLELRNSKKTVSGKKSCRCYFKGLKPLLLHILPPLASNRFECKINVLPLSLTITPRDLSLSRYFTKEESLVLMRAKCDLKIGLEKEVGSKINTLIFPVSVSANFPCQEILLCFRSSQWGCCVRRMKIWMKPEGKSYLLHAHLSTKFNVTYENQTEPI